jgi:hypothetical protein
MKEFLELYSHWRDRFGWNLEIYNSSIMDWCLKIGYKCTVANKDGVYVVDIQEVDVNRLFAKAYVLLTDWLSDNNGGY